MGSNTSSIGPPCVSMPTAPLRTHSDDHRGRGPRHGAKLVVVVRHLSWFALLLPATCVRVEPYSCSDSTECELYEEGICEPTGYCSYPDGECESGRRYSRLAGPFARECTDETPTSAGEESGSSSTGGGGLACSVDEEPDNPCTVYVAPGGSDMGRGSSDDPLGSTVAALDRAAPGDTICLRTGEYPPIRLSESGSEGAPITVRNEPGHTPVIVGDMGSASGVLIQSSAGEAHEIGWLVVAGLEISGGFNGFLLYSAHDIVIEGNNIHHNTNRGLQGGTVRMLIDGNVIANNVGHGASVMGTDITISNNLIVGNGEYGIQVAGYPFNPDFDADAAYAGGRRCKIVNNTIAGQIDKTGVILWQEGTENVVVANNVFWRNDCPAGACRFAINDLGSGGNHTFRNNVYDNAELTDVPVNGSDVANLADDAALASDYRLTEGSPAIGSGSPIDAPTHDLDRRLRDPMRNDAGAYQYCP